MIELIYPRWNDAATWDDAAFWFDNPSRPALLPQSASPAEYAMEQAVGRAEDVPVPIRPLWDAETCPVALLPWLAWALNIDEWDEQWTPAEKRASILAAVQIHRRKGTIGAIRRALTAAGYGSAEILEGAQPQLYDGVISHNGLDTYAAADHWAQYRVNLFSPVTNRQGDRIRAMLRAVAPLRCELVALNFAAAAFSYNGAIRYDGAANYGVS